MNCGLCGKPVTFVYDGFVQPDHSVNHKLCQRAQRALQEAEDLVWFMKKHGLHTSPVGAELVASFEAAHKLVWERD